jgi:subtilisin family serine protease
MKIKNSVYIASFIALAISGCGSTASMVATDPAKIDKLPLKISPIKESDLKRWSNLDLIKDTIPGMSVDKAYAEFLKGKKGVKVIVGVVDSGVDVDHEDLKSVIWTNSKEIPGNKIDDDKNGYVDDIHGWNFLGNSNYENLEMTRIVKKGDDGSQMYKDAKADLEKSKADLAPQKQQVDMLLAADKAVRAYLKKDNFTLEDVKAMQPTDGTLQQYKAMFTQILASTPKPEFDNQIKEYQDYVYNQLNYNLNTEFDGRKAVGDNPNDINDRNYGTNVVYAPDKEESLHGTHVAGIIAAVRGNNKGGDGVAKNTQILVVRAVPNGDEYDKDIALGIRYAVDNGAKIINGSFGKSYSPNKQWVYDAIKYAESKDVLIVHAAGNDGHDIDLSQYKNFPNDSDDNKTEFASNFLTIGALSTTYGSGIVANFSNYGSFNVDVFAPGMKIYSTAPNNKYVYEQGTSMASPNAAGVAAIIRSYYPSLTASQVKQILMDSGTPITTVVTLGEAEEKRPFTNASKSGKIVNAYNALLMAEKMAKKK